MKQKVFDNEVKNTFKDCNTQVPTLVHNRINETLDSLGEIDKLEENENKKPFINKKFIKGVIAASLVGITLFGVTMTSYANNIPVLDSILSHLGIGSGYNKIITQCGVSQEINGIKLTIDNVIYDGYELLVAYTIESTESLKDAPIINPKALISNADNSLFKFKSNIHFKNQYGEFKENDNRCYSGVMMFDIDENSFNSQDKSKSVKEMVIDNHKINSSVLPNKYVLDLSIDNLGDVQGNWNYSLTVESEKAKGNVKEIAVNKDLSNVFPKTKLDKAIITPIRLYLQGSLSSKNVFLGYIVINDENKQLKNVGGSTVSFNEDASYIGEFDTVDIDNKTLTLIPYNYFQGEHNNEVILNLSGETKVPLGSNRELTITKAEEKDGKTFVYYKSDFPVWQYLPFHLMDSNGIDYMKHETIVQNGETILIYDDLLLNKDLKVINNTTIHYDDAFTIDIR